MLRNVHDLTCVASDLILHVLILVEVLVPLFDIIGRFDCPKLLHYQLIAFINSDKLLEPDETVHREGAGCLLRLILLWMMPRRVQVNPHHLFEEHAILRINLHRSNSFLHIYVRWW